MRADECHVERGARRALRTRRPARRTSGTSTIAEPPVRVLERLLESLVRSSSGSKNASGSPVCIEHRNAGVGARVQTGSIRVVGQDQPAGGVAQVQAEVLPDLEATRPVVPRVPHLRCQAPAEVTVRGKERAVPLGERHEPPRMRVVVRARFARTRPPTCRRGSRRSRRSRRPSWRAARRRRGQPVAGQPATQMGCMSTTETGPGHLAQRATERRAGSVGAERQVAQALEIGSHAHARPWSR